MRSINRGDAGEALVLAALLAAGCRVQLPFGLDRTTVHLVPVADGCATKTCLRLEPTRNNQSAGVRMAADYTLERQLPSLLARAGP